MVVTPETLALLHQHASHVIYQQDQKHGVEKATLDINNQTLEWKFKGHENKNDEKVIVDPAGTAKLTPR